jgi:hypothetical protein
LAASTAAVAQFDRREIAVIRFGEPFNLCAECALREQLRQSSIRRNSK